MSGHAVESRGSTAVRQPYDSTRGVHSCPTAVASWTRRAVQPFSTAVQNVHRHPALSTGVHRHGLIRLARAISSEFVRVANCSGALAMAHKLAEVAGSLHTPRKATKVWLRYVRMPHPNVNGAPETYIDRVHSARHRSSRTRRRPAGRRAQPRSELRRTRLRA
eukprot:357131-Chlamydomonas_euryale.AAC.1